MNNPKMEVMCHVSNCKYNKNNYCYASKLEVNPQNGSFTNSSDDTICSTFVPKNQ